jgi:hypothetical protein
VSALSEFEPKNYSFKAGVAMVAGAGALMLALFVVTSQPFLLTFAVTVVTLFFGACVLLIAATTSQSNDFEEVPAAITKEDQG